MADLYNAVWYVAQAHSSSRADPTTHQLCDYSSHHRCC
jgi:hypothetical protein